MAQDPSKQFREISDKHRDRTGEHLYSGASHRGPGEPILYMFSFGSFADPTEAMGELMKRVQPAQDAPPAS